MSGSDVRDTSAWAPFRHETFRALWIAQFVSNVGTWMQSVGAVWVMVELKGSPTEVALVQTATTLPVVFFGVVGGALADLADRRRVLLATQAMMLVAAGALALLDGIWCGVAALAARLDVRARYRDRAEQSRVAGDSAGTRATRRVPASGDARWRVDQPRSRDRPGARWLPRRRGGTVVRVLVERTVVLCGDRRAGPLASGAERRRRAAERFAGAVRAGTRYAFFSHALTGVLVRAGVFSAASAGLMALLPIYSTAVLGLGSGGFGLLLAGFGIGAIAAAAFLPALRARLSEDAVVAIGTLAFAAALLGLAVIDTTAVAMALVAVAGAAWLLCLSTLNVASQQAVPGWVRAAGLAFYLSVFMGGIALGSAAWGIVANAIGSQGAFAWGALAVALTPLLALRWKLRTITDLDLSPAPMFAPEMRLAPEDATGPAFVTLTYDVRPDAHQQFLSALKRVRRARRRTGAVQWAVYRDAERPDQFIETFIVPTWDEHLRQHERRTATDLQLQDDLRPFLRDSELPHAKHYIAATRHLR